MEPAQTSFFELKSWIPLLALIVSGWSAYNSWRSRRMSARALSISESQEQRRRPKFGIYMTDGYRRYLSDKQLFVFLVSVSNPTDINNSISKAELQIMYFLDVDIKAAYRIAHSSELAETMATEVGYTASALLMPTRVDAHQTVAGLLMFCINNDVIAGRTIDSHRIIVEDSHGISSETEPISVREWTREAPKS
jgi:hypothetical protein